MQAGSCRSVLGAANEPSCRSVPGAAKRSAADQYLQLQTSTVADQCLQLQRSAAADQCLELQTSTAADQCLQQQRNTAADQCLELQRSTAAATGVFEAAKIERRFCRDTINFAVMTPPKFAAGNICFTKRVGLKFNMQQQILQKSFAAAKMRDSFSAPQACFCRCKVDIVIATLPFVFATAKSVVSPECVCASTNLPSPTILRSRQCPKSIRSSTVCTWR